MTAHARRSNAAAFDYDEFNSEQQFGNWELTPEERVAPRRSRGRGKAVLRGIILLAMIAGGGWWYLGDDAPWPSQLIGETVASLPGRIMAQIDALSSMLDRKAPPGPLASAGPLAPPPALEPIGRSAEISATPGMLGRPADPTSAAGRPAEAPLTTASLPSGSDDAPGQPLPKPIVDPSDPYQVRAAAVGLHPDLSRVLLARLTATDYKNAGYAIQTAVAETPDDGIFVWPRQRKPELALFKVHFVRGAAPDCRRYVVTVVKDGWLTTALPMEKCGPQLAQQRRG